jgi:hypothetical protein
MAVIVAVALTVCAIAALPGAVPTMAPPVCADAGPARKATAATATATAVEVNSLDIMMYSSSG